jgi:hypothetical protein
MTKAPIGLQDLRRRIYAKAKAEPSWRLSDVGETRLCYLRAASLLFELFDPLPLHDRGFGEASLAGPGGPLEGPGRSRTNRNLAAERGSGSLVAWARRSGAGAVGCGGSVSPEMPSRSTRSPTSSARISPGRTPWHAARKALRRSKGIRSRMARCRRAREDRRRGVGDRTDFGLRPHLARKCPDLARTCGRSAGNG